MAGVCACGVPMVLWSMLVDKVHLRPSTGIDWKHPKPFRETLDISLVKLTGLWATWAGIAVIYCLARWYWNGGYLFRSEEHTSELQSLMRISYAVFFLKHKYTNQYLL